MSEAFICDVPRTPVGLFGGVLASIPTDDLASLPLAPCTIAAGFRQGVATIIERV